MRANAWLPVLILSCMSCRDVFIEDLSMSRIVLKAPPNNTVATGAITFWWDEVKGAFSYELQVVEPGFTNAVRVVLDTFITATQLNYQFPPGSYQWKVRAVNNESSTPFSAIRNLAVDSSSELSGLEVILITPIAQYLTNDPSVDFLWTLLAAASSYQVQIASPAFGSTYTVALDTSVSVNSLTFPLPGGKYEWRVRAFNAVSTTGYSTPRLLEVDTTAPLPPVLISPAHGDTISTNDILIWSPDPMSAGDTVYIFPDSLISAPVTVMFHSDTMHTVTNTVPQNYFWRVRSFDAAGNNGTFSQVRKFVLQ